MMCVKFTAFCDLRIRLATLLQTCVDLRRLAGPFGQGFRRAKHKASVMFKVTNKKAPEYLSEMFTKVEETNPLLSSSLRVSIFFPSFFFPFLLFCFVFMCALGILGNWSAAYRGKIELKMATSFQKKGSRGRVYPSGTRASLHNNQLLVSTGIPSMDNVIGKNCLRFFVSDNTTKDSGLIKSVCYDLDFDIFTVFLLKFPRI